MSTVRPSDPAAPPSLDLIVNGRAVSTAGVAPTTTLLSWLRANGLTGSKEGCAEGDCGACSVALVDRDANGKPTYRAFNSCIALVPMFAGREIVTVEGLAKCGADQKQLHPVQAALIAHDGFQCGFCTPGQIMSAIGLIREGQAGDDPERIREGMSGNLCRCGAYVGITEAILEAQKNLTEANQRRSA